MKNEIKHFQLAILVSIGLLFGACAGPGPNYSSGSEYSPVAGATVAEAAIPGSVVTPDCCEAPTPSVVTSVTGTVTYREKIALPPNAEVSVVLFDLSEFDALRTVVGEQKVVTGGKQVPFPFEITYDPASIDQKLNYAVRATVTIDGRPAFTSVERYLVLTKGNLSQATIEVSHVPALTREFQELRKVKGHWQGGDSNPEVDSPRGRMRLVMGALAETLGRLPMAKDDLVSLMGLPDETRTAGSEEQLVYLWRNWHDYVYFVIRDGTLAGFQWWYAWE